MSASNGDKSRFHRMRKQRIARREKIRELHKQVAERAAAAPPAKA